MIRFSAWGSYLLLVSQGRALIRDRTLISFLRNNRKFTTTVEDQIVRLKELIMNSDEHSS